MATNEELNETEERVARLFGDVIARHRFCAENPDQAESPEYLVFDVSTMDLVRLACLTAADWGINRSGGQPISYQSYELNKVLLAEIENRISWAEHDGLPTAWLDTPISDATAGELSDDV